MRPQGNFILLKEHAYTGAGGPSVIKKTKRYQSVGWNVSVKPHQRTVRVGRLTQREEVYYRIVHLQNSGALPVHHRQTRPPAHRVVGQTTGQDNERFPGTHTHTHISYLQQHHTLCLRL